MNHAPSPARPAARRITKLTMVIAAVAATVVTFTLVAPHADASVPSTPSGWSLLFSDDFSGTANTGVDTSKWQYATGTGYPGGPANWGTGEVETMTDSTDNVFLDGSGRLVIKPTRDSSGNWSSGRIETNRTDIAAPAGGKLRVEARLRQPNVSGSAAAGYWPAFWMLGADYRGNYQNWPGVGEIDIMEDVNGLSSVWSTLHCGTNPGGECNETTGLGTGQQACSTCQTAYHTYTMEQDRTTSPEYIRWYLDGNLLGSVNSSQVSASTWDAATHHGFFIILNVAIGGAFPVALGTDVTSATASGVSMRVDYVAAWTTTGTTTPTTTTTTPTTATTTASAGTRDAYSTIQAEDYDAQSGTGTETTSDTGGGSNVGWIANGDWLQFNNVDFGSTAATQFKARVASGAASGISGLVEVRLDSLSNAPVSAFAIANTGGWQSWTTIPFNMSSVTGTHTVYITFTSGQSADFVNINWFTFTH